MHIRSKIHINIALLVQFGATFIGISIFAAIGWMLTILSIQDFFSHNPEGRAMMLLTSGLMVCGIIGGFWLSLIRNETTKQRWFRHMLAIQALLILLAAIFFATLQFSSPTSSTVSTHAAGGIVGSDRFTAFISLKRERLFELTNQERIKNHLTPLVLDSQLNQSATNKCNDMVQKDYWSHNDPSGKKPWPFFEEVGYKYALAGENLARKYATEAGIIKGWMNSPTHRQNLLAPGYKDVGFGICKSENYVGEGPAYIVVQHFGTKAPAKAQQGAKGVESPKDQSPPAIEVKPYVAPVCTKKTIPYKTVYEDTPYLYPEDTYSIGGYDGYIETCTADSTGYKPPDFTIQPIDKVVHRGTKPTPTPSTTPTPNTP